MTFETLPREIVKRGWKARQAYWDASNAARLADMAKRDFETEVIAWKGPVSFSEVVCEASPAGCCVYDGEQLCIFCRRTREPIDIFLKKD